MADWRTETITNPAPPRSAPRASARRAYLVVVRGAQINRFYLAAGKMTIGRDRTADIQVTDFGVSRLHAEVNVGDDGELTVRDLSSRNGLWVNDARVEQASLRGGDTITLGEGACLRVVYQEEAETKLHENQRLESLGRLAGGVAHEFNNLLAAIVGNLSFLQTRLLNKGEAADQEIVSSLEDSLAEAQHGAELTRGLLSYARRDQPVVEPVPMQPFLVRFARLARRTLDRSYTIEASTRGGPVMLGDGSQLQQALLNLVLNARDAMPRGGRIAIAARPRQISASDLVGTLLPGSYIEVTVSDEGSGVSAEAADRVFEPFFTTKDIGKGTGIGLSVVHGIVRSHGGFVDFESRAGVGTTFRLLFPAALDAPEAAEAETARDAIATGDEFRVLVVDDEGGVRRSVGRMLRSLGHQVKLAASGEEALVSYRELGEELDVVMLDLGMPDLDGEETFHRLRAIDPEVQVVLHTGYGDDQRLERLRGAGVPVVHKPALREELDDVLRQVVLGLPADGGERA